VNAYAASAFYGTPAIVVDFGTAITFDIISKNGEYLGGMILPGLRISLDSLAERTALLPRVSLNCPRELIGRDTKNSILSGIVYGFAAMADNLSERIKRIIGRNACVIGTGGNISLIAKYCRKLNKVDRDLTLKGLNLLYRRQAIF
jgi:type III pantothenate kinase